MEFQSWKHSQSSEWLFWIFLDQSRCVTLFEVNLEGGWNDMSCGQVFRLSQHLELVLVLLLDGMRWLFYLHVGYSQGYVTWWAHITNYVKTSYWTNIYVIYHDFLNTTGFFPRWKTTARRWKKVRPQASHICRARKVCQTLPRWWPDPWARRTDRGFFG